MAVNTPWQLIKQRVLYCLQILTAKCLGRRICRDCGKNFNVADIMLPASNGQPEVRMPPLNPPENCVDKMEIRSDDNLETVKNRIEVGSNTLHRIWRRRYASCDMSNGTCVD